MFYIVENTEQLGETFIQKAVPGLSIQRLEKMEKFRRLPDRVNSAVVYLLLRYALIKEHGITDKPDFIFGNHEKPYLSAFPDIFFGLSHCRNSCACMIDKTETAADITDFRKISIKNARYFCSEQELQNLEITVHPEKEVIRLWTMKECFAKADGSGLYANFKTIGSQQYQYVQLTETEQYIAACYAPVKTDVITITDPEILLTVI